MFSKLSLPVNISVIGKDDGFKTFVQDLNDNRLIVNSAFTFGYAGHGSNALINAINQIPNFEGDLSFIKKIGHQLM